MDVTATAASLRGDGTSPKCVGDDQVSVDVSNRHKSFLKPPLEAFCWYPPRSQISVLKPSPVAYVSRAACEPENGAGVANTHACDRAGGLR
jgi:hypothetical protein